MNFENKYLRNFKPYKVGSHKVWQVSPNERKEILKLDWNEAGIEPSPKVKERLLSMVQDGSFFNLYPSTYNENLLQLLSDYVGLPRNNIQYFGSSDSLHEYLAKLFISVGDPILILGPTYDNFRLTAEVNGAHVFYHWFDDNWGFSQERFEKDIETIRPSLVYICNPNNPTGYLHSVDFIEYLVNKYTEVMFLVDEAYAEFSSVSAKGLVITHNNIVISRTMSKAFALANFRFGYLLASEKNVEYISRIRNSKNISTFAQEAAIGALSDVEYMQRYVGEVKKAQAYFLDASKAFSEWFIVVPSYGNFNMAICKNNRIKRDVLKHLENNNIFIRPLNQTDFLRDRGIRFTIGTIDQMRKVIECLKNLFDNYE